MKWPDAVERARIAIKDLDSLDAPVDFGQLTAAKEKTSPRGHTGLRQPCSRRNDRGVQRRMIFDSDFHAPVGEQEAPLLAGWHRPQNSQKWHYYTNGKSLCGKWVLFGGIIRKSNQGFKTSGDDCSRCRQRWELIRED